MAYVGEGRRECRRGDRKKVTAEKLVPRMKLTKLWSVELMGYSSS